MDKVYDQEVRPLLDLVETLRELGIESDISLPQIAVMGDQSSGKSSVLQSICGIPFPRGSGLGESPKTLKLSKFYYKYTIIFISYSLPHSSNNEQIQTWHSLARPHICELVFPPAPRKRPDRLHLHASL
jgi:hypothetical protein